jgi:hypothetical protein
VQDLLLMDRDDRPDRARVADLIARAHTASSDESTHVAALVARCWPGGTDRLAPAAVDWVRRWQARPLMVAPAGCACDAGRCGVCN